MHRAILATLGLCLVVLAAPAQAESLTDCRGLAEAEARLACYDALAPGEAVGPEVLLTQLLGDAEAIGKDYSWLGNNTAILKLLPGRWQILPWDLAQSVIHKDLVSKSCERVYYLVEPSESDSYAFKVTQASTKLGNFHRWDILPSTRGRFGHAMNMEGTLAAYGLDPAKINAATINSILARAVVWYSYLPLSQDAILLIDSQNPDALVMLRCPEAS